LSGHPRKEFQTGPVIDGQILIDTAGHEIGPLLQILCLLIDLKGVDSRDSDPGKGKKNGQGDEELTWIEEPEKTSMLHGNSLSLVVK
jgi:hypothetical protein